MEPTAAFDRLLGEVVRPFYSVLESIIEEIIGDQMSEEKILFCCESIFSQCLRYKVKPVIAGCFEQDVYSPEGIDRIADHITRFSLMGLRHLSARTDCTWTVKSRASRKASGPRRIPEKAGIRRNSEWHGRIEEKDFVMGAL